ncbi:hypothetical protein [Calidifontibacillus oryziterrae]|uniref:hypothetical protein n=1 Tax=Calidifontibacillus oryziterrae TaxID=1191699 RepID=UPI0002DE3B0D|nr:hypothetical protein [Calidifontibacillus oryziterrae]
MKNSVMIFLVCAVIGFGGGALFNQAKGSNEASTPDVETTKQTETVAEGNTEVVQPANTVSGEGQIISDKGCLACHAVENLGLQGGATGPDLSDAYTNVEGKHGKPIEEFLKEPTSAVMSTVIGGNPLTDEERTKIVEALKIASEK